MGVPVEEEEEEERKRKSERTRSAIQVTMGEEEGVEGRNWKEGGEGGCELLNETTNGFSKRKS